MGNSVIVIGSGRVAEAMCRRVAGSGNKLVQVAARNAKKGAALAEKYGASFESIPSKVGKAEIYIIAVSDKAIGEVSESIDFGDSIVVHTSGSCRMNELAAGIKNKGVLYPLQTFTQGREPDFLNIPLFIEASDAASYGTLETFARSLSDSVHFADSEIRRKMHMAAVFVCNFVNQMFNIGEQIMESSGLDYSLLKPLIRETTAKMIESAASPADLQTGPALRRDYFTIDKHLELLARSPELRNIYKVLTDSIIRSSSGVKLYITPGC